MTTSTDGEATPLLSTPDSRKSYKKQLVIHLILASILFESAAFYALDSNLPKSLKLNDISDYSWTIMASFRGRGPNRPIFRGPVRPTAGCGPYEPACAC